MPFKPNYNQQRAERDRAKQAKKEAKQKEKEELAMRRKMQDASPGEASDGADDAPAQGSAPVAEPNHEA